MKCIKPIKHRPQFQGKINCKACEAELLTNEKVTKMKNEWNWMSQNDAEYDCQKCGKSYPLIQFARYRFHADVDWKCESCHKEAVQ